MCVWVRVRARVQPPVLAGTDYDYSDDHALLHIDYPDELESPPPPQPDEEEFAYLYTSNGGRRVRFEDENSG